MWPLLDGKKAMGARDGFPSYRQKVPRIKRDAIFVNYSLPASHLTWLLHLTAISPHPTSIYLIVTSLTSPAPAPARGL